MISFLESIINVNNWRQYIIILRSLDLIFLLLSIICVLISGRVCTYLSCVQVFSISWWKYNKLFGGQYFVFITSTIWICVTNFLLIYDAVLQKLSKIQSFTITTVGATLMFINFCLEAWYSSFPGVSGASSYVESYIAATVFYFALTILFILDAILLTKSTTTTVVTPENDT